MTTALDPATIKSWEDAFQHQIPQVRQLERQLRVDLASNKEKLRSLVGESYRELLETAERIIQMDSSAHKLELNLSEASRNCNSRLLDRKARNLKTFQQSVGAEDCVKYTQAAQLDVLQRCPSILSRFLSQEDGERCLLAAKIYIISRLIVKNFPDNSSVPILAPLRGNLSDLRPLLLRHLDSLLGSAVLGTAPLLSCLTALSLVKSASPSEVLRHFLHVRSHSCTRESSTLTPDDVIACVSLFNKTLADADAIFPQKLSKALVVLKSTCLLYDEDVFNVTDLSLDVNARWLPEDIRGFKPWIQHDDLTSSKVNDTLRVWAENEASNLISMLSKSLGAITDIQEAVTFRGKIMKVWRIGSSLRRKHFPREQLFRDLFRERTSTIISAQAKGLERPFENLEKLLARQVQGSEDVTCLWSSSLLTMDISAGAMDFRETIADLVDGRRAPVRNFLQQHQLWLSGISRISKVLGHLRSPSQAADEDEDFEAEEDRIQEDLDDSEVAEKELVTALDSVYHQMDTRLNATVEEIASDDREIEDPGQIILDQSVLLLRIIRQVIHNPPGRKDSNALVPLSWFGASAIPKLHGLIAAAVAKLLVIKTSITLDKRSWESPFAAQSIWEGTPPLPSQSSSLVSGLLHGLVREMSSIGEDIWTPSAVKALKIAASDGLWELLAPMLEARDIIELSQASVSASTTVVTAKEVPSHESSANLETPADESGANESEEPACTTEERPEGDDKEGPSVEPQPKPEPVRAITREWAIQVLFDALYLDEAFQRRHRRGQLTGVSLAAKVDSVFGTNLHMDEDLRMRLEGSVSEYWKRTALLFSLLNN